MNRSICLLFIALSIRVCCAQTPLYTTHYTDSLNNILQKQVSDSVKARVNFLLSNYWVVNDISKAQKYLHDGRKWSKKDPFLTALSYVAEGYYYFSTDITTSEKVYLRADSLLKQIKSKEALAIRSKIWANIGVIRQRKDDDKGYIDLMLNRAIPLTIAAGDSASLGSLYVGLGVAFMNTEQNDKAGIYLDKAILLLKDREPFRLASAYNRAGENYMLLKKWDKVKEMLEANKLLLAAYPESDQYAGYYLVEGTYLHELKQYTAAVNSFKNGIAKASGPNKAYVIQELNFYQAKSLLANQRYHEAKKIVMQLATDADAMALDQSRLEIYQDLANVYTGTRQNDSALYWLTKYSHLNDSLHDSQFKHDINELEAKYQQAENQQKIASLQTEKAEAALSANNNRLYNWLLGTACIFFLTVTGFSLFLYKNSKKLSQQKDINYRQQLKELAQQQQLRVAKAMLDGEERERGRLARDLHDGLGGMLSGIKLNLSGWAIRQQISQQDLPFYEAIMQLDNSVGELRRIAHNMMPGTLLKLGLEAALQDLCHFHQKAGMYIDFQSFQISKSLSLPEQANIYRIVQELLANAIRHSGASQILLQCSQNGNHFLISIEDNGKGFDSKALADKAGLGLSNLKNRVEYMEGTLNISSTIGEGTIIHIELKSAYSK